MTFGRRLRGMRVSLEYCEDLLGHQSGRMTTHCSAAEIENLIEVAERVCSADSRKTHAVIFFRVVERGGCCHYLKLK